VLGPASRMVTLKNRILVWDDLGVYAYLDLQRDTIHAMTFAQSCAGYEYCPLTAYRGDIIVAGVRLRPGFDTTALSGRRFDSDPVSFSKQVGKYHVVLFSMGNVIGIGGVEVDFTGSGNS
jgi:hypothetical protein